MSDITINYKGAAISTMDASGTKTLLTEGKYCEDDIEVVYVKPSGGGGADYTISTHNRTDNSAINVDREYDDFILLAYLSDEPTAYPSNNYAVAMMFAYVDDEYWMPSKSALVKSSGSSFSSAVASPSVLAVSATNIAISAYSSANNARGYWTIVQIEVPSTAGMYSWRKVVI